MIARSSTTSPHADTHTGTEFKSNNRAKETRASKVKQPNAYTEKLSALRGIALITLFLLLIIDERSPLIVCCIMAIIGFDPIAIVRLSIRTLFGIANTFEPRIRVNVSALPVPTEVDTITISSALTRFFIVILAILDDSKALAVQRCFN